MAAGRTRSLLGFGWAHFLVYATGVLLVAPLGISAVALVAAAVHSAFLLVAYALMLRGTEEKVLRRLWLDTGPAAVSCLAFAVAAVPAALALTRTGSSPLVLILAVAVLGGGAYLLALRSLFADVWRTALRMIGRVIPRHRLPRLRGLIPAGVRQAP
jgi:hypothetical protein